MRESVFGLAIAFAIVTAGPPAASAADVVAYPQWSSDQVRSARPLGPENAIVFDLQTEDGGGKSPATILRSTVTLSASFTYIVTGADHMLSDRTLCRALSWSDGKPGLQSTSCYAGPAFRVLELANRQDLTKMLSKLKTALPQDSDPYWAEAELGVQDEAVDRLQKRTSPTATSYLFGNEEVVRLVGPFTPLAGDESERVVRYFANDQPLHPQVRRDLKLSAALPAQLKIEHWADGEKRQLVLTITNVRRESVAYPLPGRLISDIRLSADKADPSTAKGLQQSLLAIDGRSSVPKPTAEELLASMQGAADHGSWVQATLIFFELTQQYPTLFTGSDSQAFLNKTRPLFLKMKADSGASRILQANALAADAQTAGDRQAAARYLAQASDLDRLPFGTFRYVTFANLVHASPDAAKWDSAIFKAMPTPLAANYWVHIAAYPWASNAYKDAGDTYLADYDMPEAWLAYDLGRAVDSDWRLGAMKALSDFEDRLRVVEPDFF